MPKRFIGMLVFAANACTMNVKKLGPRPDVIIGSTVHPFAAWAAARLAKRMHVPFVYEVRDVWPDYLVDLGKIRPNGLLSHIFRAISRALLRQSRLVISPLRNLPRYLAEMGFTDTPFVWIPNGTDTSSVVTPTVADQDSDQFTFMYLGTHGEANALPGILDAFETVWIDNPATRLRLVGDGPLKSRLEEHARGLRSAEAVFFEDRIPRDQVLTRASEADALVINFEDHDVYRFGISPNKLFDYMLAERPVVIATNDDSNPVTLARAGVTAKAGDTAALAQAMASLTSLPKSERVAMGQNGRAHVVRNYDYSDISVHLAASLEEVRTEWLAEDSAWEGDGS